MEALLESDALNVTTENEVYTLLGCWVVQSPHAGASGGLSEVPWANCPPLYKRLVKHVRLQHLPLEYIVNVVKACPLAIKSDLLPSILLLGLATRQPNSDFLKNEAGVEPLPLDRGRGGHGWNYTTKITLTDLLPLEEDQGVRKYLGPADGRPVSLILGRYKESCGQMNFGFYLSLMAHFGKGDVFEARISRAVNLQYKVRVGKVEVAWDEHRGHMRPVEVGIEVPA